MHGNLSGDTCAAGGITARGAAPVLALCRKLIAAGHDPATPLHIYRGDTLTLTVRSIGRGAELTVVSAGNGTPIFAKARAAGGFTGPATRKNEWPLCRVPPQQERASEAVS